MQFAQKLALKYIRTKFSLLSLVSKRRAAQQAFKLFCTPQYRNKKKIPPIFEKAEVLNFNFGAERIQGYRWNADGEKKALIVHGFESSVINFDRYVKPLITKGYQVLAFDAPAHGRSSGRRINAVTYREFLRRIFSDYGPIDSFIAHSFGCLAVSLVLETVVHDRTTKVVMIAPAVESKTAALNFYRAIRLKDEVKSEFAKLIRCVEGHSLEWYSIQRAIQHLDASILIFQDKDDHMTPYSDLEPIIDMKLPNVEFVISQGLGHRRIYRDNKTSKKILEFL